MSGIHGNEARMLITSGAFFFLGLVQGGDTSTRTGAFMSAEICQELIDSKARPEFVLRW